MNAAVSAFPSQPTRSADLLRAAGAFRALHDPRKMYLGKAQRHALAGLQRLAADGCGGVGLLTGAPGLGKTLLRGALHQSAAVERCAVVALETALLGFDDLLLEILSQLRGERVLPAELPGRYERIAELKAALMSQVVASGRHLLVLCDDAEQLDPATLEAIGALGNLCSERQAFVVPVFIGQPSLRQKLARLPGLRQRIGGHFTLAALEPDETRHYLEHRLRGADLALPEVLEPALAGRIHVASGGVPRVIDTLCRHLLRHAGDHGQPRATVASLDACRLQLLEPGAGPVPGFPGH